MQIPFWKKHAVIALPENPKLALEAYIQELETDYYPWYETAAQRNYYLWTTARIMVVLSGFGTAVLAALLRDADFKDYGWGRILLIVLPFLGSLASTFMVQTRIRDLMALRERGRESLQHLITTARSQFAAASNPDDYKQLHESLAQQVSVLEQEQSRNFLSIVPERLP